MIYKSWLASKAIDNKDKARINEMTKSERQDAFLGILNFGTAGLRGIMDIGTARMNKYVVAHVSQAIANFMKDNKQKNVVVACDVRNNSDLFKNTTVNVFLLNGLNVYIFDSVVPISLVSYAVRKLKCDFGIYITASHNPKEYNGYKVFDRTGCQINEKIANKINEYRNEVDILNVYEKSDNKPVIIDDSILKSFTKEIKHCKVHDCNDIDITYTGLFGTGNGFVNKMLEHFKFTVHTVKEESSFNGDFPNLETPNPEDESVFKNALQVAAENNSDIIIATDPDADRLGVMVKHNNKYVKLSGNQVGVLLTNYFAKYKKAKKPMIAFSDVSSDMARDICKKQKIESAIVPAGFKYIGAKINENKRTFLFGFEESCGYLVGPYIRDKDSVGAAVLIAEMVAFYKNKNMTLIDELNKLYERYGYHQEKTISFPIKNKPSMFKILTWVTENDFKFGKLTLNEDMLYLEVRDGGSILFRMSGTEPKMKVYVKSVAKTKEESDTMLNSYLDMVSIMRKNLEMD